MPSTPLRVCLVAPLPPPYGGIGHWTSMILRYASTCANIKLFSVNTAPCLRTIYDLAIWKRILIAGFQSIRDIFLFCTIILGHRPHVVHLTTSGHLSVIRDTVVVLIAALFHVPVVYHIHFGRVPQIVEENGWEWQFMSRVMAKSHTVIPIDAATEYAIKRNQPNIRVKRIPNCINIKGLPKQGQNLPQTRTVLFLGWVIPTKGIYELIEAWTQLYPAGWRLVIVGPGDQTYRQQLIDTFRPETLEFLGELSHEEAMKQLAQADIFVLPSYTEGFPNVVLEAMALGKAIVATDVGAIPEMLSGGCGVLVKPRDAKGLADAMGRLIAAPPLRRIMGECARTRALAKFSLELVFTSYISVWQQAAGLGLQETLEG